MHRAHGNEPQDLLLNAFEEVLLSGKEGDWKEVEQTLMRIDEQVKKHDRIFGTRVRDKLRRAMTNRNHGEILKYLAQTVFLSIKDQFRLILNTQMEDFFDSTARLDKAKDYYSKILSGNIKRRDIDRHIKIEGHFLLAKAALGNPGVFIDLPVMEGDLQSFEKAISDIEAEVTHVYTYFTEN